VAGESGSPQVLRTRMSALRYWLAFVVIIAVWAWVLPRLEGFRPFLKSGGQVVWSLTVHAALFSASGVFLILWVVGDAWRRRDAVSILIGLWVVGVFVFVTLINWTVNGRSLLPMAPALAILLVRRWEERLPRQKDAPLSRRAGVCLVLAAIAAAVFSLALVKADCNVARVERDVTCGLYKKYERPGRTVWFEGHGGYQFYLEKLGARPLDMARPQIGPEDVVIVPNCAPGVSTPNLNVVTVIDAVKYQPNRFYSTSEPSLGAAFYEAVRGPLPYAAGHPKADYCFVFAVKK
jgi:hypothetical protein